MARPVVAYVSVPATDALDAKHDSSWGTQTLSGIVRTFGKFPKIEMQERPKKADLSSWRSAKLLYLYTHLFDRGSPVHAGGLDYAIPLYLLPLKETQREYLVRWDDPIVIMTQYGLVLELSKCRPISNLPTRIANCRKKGGSTVRKLKPSRGNPHITFLYAIMAVDELKMGVGVPSAVDHGQPGKDLENPCDSIILLFSATAVGLFRSKLVTTTID